MVVNKTNFLNSKHYERFRENVKNMKAVTDSKPPKLKIANYLKIANIAQDKAKLKSNLKANLAMLETVNVIQRTTGFVDNSMSPPLFNESKEKQKLKAVRNLEKSNKELLKKFNGMV